MHVPKVVVFDLGKVLLDFDYAILSSKLESRCSVPAHEVRRLIDQSPLLYRYETGLVSTAEFIEEIAKLSGFNGRHAELCETFADIFTPIDPMVELHSQLAGKGVPTYLLSNTNELAIGHIRRRFAFYHDFRGHILSFEVRAMKPDPSLYLAMEELTGRHGGDLLYIDDRPENLEPARTRGWQVIHHLEPETTIHAVMRSGVLGEKARSSRSP